MTLLAALASAGGTPTPPPARTIDSLDHRVIDWAGYSLIVDKAQIPACLSLREQDDIIYDPAMPPNKRYCFYVTAMIDVWVDGVRRYDSEVWVVYSPDLATWSSPVRCVMDTGGPLRGQDPSIVTTLHPTLPVVHRDDDGRLLMYLENDPDPSNHSTHLYSSADGVTWHLEMLNVIPNGASDAEWDFRIGSPNARYINGHYVVGFEGFGAASLEECWGAAVGTSPTELVKFPAPLIRGLDHGVGRSCFMDSWWLSADGTRIMVTGHSGIAGTTGMQRFYTENTNPLTWTPADFHYINDTDPAITNDLTACVYNDRVVTAPANDYRMWLLPLIPPA